jgi:hypothetical protein
VKFRYVENKVNEILKTAPATRDDDNLLLISYLQTLDDFEIPEGVIEFILNERIATKFKTVERVRRKLQEKNPALRGSAWLKRHETQADFIQYAFDLD